MSLREILKWFRSSGRFQREMKLAKRKRAASWIGAGASALFLAGAGLMYCFAPSPLRVPTDFETLPLEKKSIVVTAECEYDDVAGFFRFGNYDILLEKSIEVSRE